jgi:glycosyltransferase involved in cell wall biosynthesis
MTKTDISIIVATRNREQILWETVAKAYAAIENKNAEIIIINDGDAELIVPSFFAGKIRCFKNEGKGVSAARNLGAVYAKGGILFFIDDDMWINAGAIDWINLFVIEKKNINSVYFINWEYPAYLSQKLENSKVGRYILAASYNKLWGRMQKKGEQPLNGLYVYDKIGSCSLVMSKSIFDNIGGYNEAIIFAGEDEDLANKINASGIPIYVVFDIMLHHNHQDRLEINSFLKRIYDGAGSEFEAVKAGAIYPTGNTNYKGIKLLFFYFFSKTEKGWIFLHKLFPGFKFLQPLQNKVIGVLGGLQKYKQWRKIIYKAK